MVNTKENILMTALRLFAQNGYEAVSVSEIAGELGLTKGALYKHYKNKRDIFNSIVARVRQLDIERSKKAGIHEKNLGEMLPFRNTSAESIKVYMESQYNYWVSDKIACYFRRMLTLEQYRNPEMAKLYQKVLVGGPVSFIEELFREMMLQGSLQKGSPKQMAVEFYAPFYLLLSISDMASDKEEKEKTAIIFKTHIESFMEKYAMKQL